ncbi:type II toxin-antitoxin system RelE/ParE family toxin [Massilia rubra]|uniref:Type II toxin-antitoxin system RelE/ParE family toxin n=1 Tax=Massilia rubra TaxID=2607910 RepID=A0ABX0LP50_9BURK|nr:type II toxin-antitoxin system RelE/ParE family toxin [Massilia rubra]NHZ33682.1 type II toxin-antitoxin system RelE/ParE family toxin [Massilia rubra]
MPKRTSSPEAAAAAAPRLQHVRVFKTAWFARAARKRGIADPELCKAMKEVMEGKADALGGGVWKKRLNDNMDRSIIAAKGEKNWIFLFLYMKKDRENIDKAEETQFKKLAGSYALLTPSAIAALLKSCDLVEICHEQY